MKVLKFITFFFTVLVIAFTPLDALEISEGSGVTYGRYFFIAMAASALLSNDLFVKKRVFPIFKILLCFIIWATLTSVWSINTDVTFGRVVLLIQYAIIFSVMTNTLNTPKKLRIAMLGWMIGASYIAYKTATDFNTYAEHSNTLYRVEEFGNPNENSFMLCYAVLFCYLIDKTRLRIPSIAFTVFSVYAFIANGSRMGILIFLVAVAGFCVQLWSGGKKWYIIALIPVIIGFGSYVLEHIPTATLLRIFGIADNIEARSFSHRETIWTCANYLLTDHQIYYLFGCGWGTFNIAIREYLGIAMGAHNFYLDLLCTTGIVGLSIVGYYLYRLFKIIRITYKADIVNYLMLFIPMISMMSTNWQSRRWWFLMGAFIYLIYQNRNFYSKNAKEHLPRKN